MQNNAGSHQYSYLHPNGLVNGKRSSAFTLVDAWWLLFFCCFFSICVVGICNDHGALQDGRRVTAVDFDTPLQAALAAETLHDAKRRRRGQRGKNRGSVAVHANTPICVLTCSDGTQHVRLLITMIIIAAAAAAAARRWRVLTPPLQPVYAMADGVLLERNERLLQAPELVNRLVGGTWRLASWRVLTALARFDRANATATSASCCRTQSTQPPPNNDVTTYRENERVVARRTRWDVAEK